MNGDAREASHRVCDRDFLGDLEYMVYITMCEIENDYTLGSYAKSHDIYVYREGAGAGPHVGEIERGEWCTRRQSVLVCSGGGV